MILGVPNQRDVPIFIAIFPEMQPYFFSSKLMSPYFFRKDSLDLLTFSMIIAFFMKKPQCFGLRLWI